MTRPGEWNRAGMLGHIGGVDWGAAMAVAATEPGLDRAIFRRLFGEAEIGFLDGVRELQERKTDG